MAWSDLPEDIAIHTLSRLPVKSLLRFKCVCKSWCALIQSPNFIAQRFDHSNYNNTNSKGIGPLLVKRTHVIVDYNEEVDAKDSFFLVTGENFEVILDLDLPYFKDELKVRLDMVGSCNGIVCLRDFESNNGEIYLWNPATRAFRALPESLICLGLNPEYLDKMCSDVGFGFDAKTNDYKVVRVVNHLQFNANDGQWWWAIPQVEVYSLSTGSWRLINEGLPPVGTIRVNSCRGYLNGIYFWWAKDVDTPDEVMLSFDMSKEVFRTTPLPDVCAVCPFPTYAKCFVVLNESIALIIFPILVMEKSIEIWVLNRYGVEESWTKFYTIGPIARHFNPLGFSKNGELFAGARDGRLQLCDPITQEIKDFQVPGEQSFSQALFYKESLVSIKGG